MTPDYRIIQDYQSFEIREYSPHLAIQVELDQCFEDAAVKGYGLLTEYLSGENSKNEILDFLSPLYQAKKKSIEQGFNKFKKDQSSEYVLQVLLPEKYDLSSAPRPTCKQVKIVELPCRRVAALKYSGFWTRTNFHKHFIKLKAILIERGMNPHNEPSLARYDSPLWPWFLRRNEVLIEL